MKHFSIMSEYYSHTQIKTNVKGINFYDHSSKNEFQINFSIKYFTRHDSNDLLALNVCHIDSFQ